MLRTTALLLCLGLACLTAGADEIHTTDGRKLTGKLIDRGDFWEVKMAFGSIKVKKSDVVRIVRKKTDADRFAEKKQQLDPQDADGWYRLAAWCKQQKLDKWVRRAASKAIELDSEHAGARKLLGQVQVGGRWVDEAEAARLKADMQAAQMRAQGKVRLGNRWVTAGEYKQAFRRAVGQYNRGNQLLRMRQYRPAITQYEQALAAFPEFDLVRMRMALAYLYMKQQAKAIGILRRMIKKTPHVATLHYNLGIAYEMVKRYGSAMQAYLEALELEPRRQDAMNSAINLARYLKRKKVLQQLEVRRAEYLKEALIGIYRATLPDGYRLTITLQERPIKINKRVLERTATGGLKPVMQTSSGKATPLRNDKARLYGHQVGEPRQVDSETFKKANTRLRTVSTFPVYIDDFKQAGWAFAFRNAPMIRLKIMRFDLEKDGQRVAAPAGTLKINYFSYRGIDYRDGRVLDAERRDNLTLWRKMAAGDWPEKGFLAVPSCVADCVEIDLTLEDGTRIREAFVYDHERGVIRQVSAADWKKGAAGADRPAADRPRDARSRAIALFGELTRTMAGYKADGTDPKAAKVRSWIESWRKRVGRLHGETVDPDVRLALDDMRTLLREYEADLAGKPADRIGFFAGEIKQQLGIR